MLRLFFCPAPDDVCVRVSCVLVRLVSVSVPVPSSRSSKQHALASICKHARNHARARAGGYGGDRGDYGGDRGGYGGDRGGGGGGDWGRGDGGGSGW